MLVPGFQLKCPTLQSTWFFCHVLSKRGVQHKQQRLFGTMITRGVVARWKDDDRWIGGSKFQNTNTQRQYPISPRARWHCSGQHAWHKFCAFTHLPLETFQPSKLKPLSLEPSPLTFLIPWPLRSCCYEKPALLRKSTAVIKKTQSSPSMMWISTYSDPSFSTPVHISMQ